MWTKQIIIFMFCCLLCLGKGAAQVRHTDFNTISWNASFNTIYIAKHVSLWVEYQWRREQFLTNWAQSMGRGGVQYHFNGGVSVMAGYGYIVSFPYGDFPAGPHTVPEHRIFEQVIWNGDVGRVSFNHRLRLEQRFAGKVDQKAADYNVSDWTYLNRIRYQLRMTIPLNHNKLVDKTWYVLPFDELLIGFGPNVNQNIYDQNRVGLLVGYNFSKMLKIEAGFLNQTLQQGGLVGGKEVIQYNNGMMLNVFFTKPYGVSRTKHGAN